MIGSAKVSDHARIEDFPIIKGSAQIYDNAVVKENAMVFTNAKVYGDAIVSGSARVFRGSEIYGNAFVTDNAFLIMTKVYGNAIVCGNLWHRVNNSFEIVGICFAGGDSVVFVFIASCYTFSVADISGTFLLWS